MSIAGTAAGRGERRGSRCSTAGQPGRRQGTEEDGASRGSRAGGAGGADDGRPRIPKDVGKLARQRRAFLGEVVWEPFQTEGAMGKERLKQKVEMMERLFHTIRGSEIKLRKIIKHQTLKNKLVALNFTLTAWNPDGELEAGEERPPTEADKHSVEILQVAGGEEQVRTLRLHRPRGRTPRVTPRGKRSG